MKVLITNNRLADRPGGSEWHAYELCLALMRNGCTVSAYSPKLGWFSDRLKEQGVKVYSHPPHDSFDLILASHTSTINKIDRSKTKGKLVQICHGVYPELEQPLQKADMHVAISDEVNAHLKSKGFKSEVILNGVDHSKFKPSESGSGILSLCQGEFANSMIKEACDSIGVELTIMNKYKGYSYNLHEIIPKYELVISIGRGAYEAMACNKKLIVLDSRIYVNKNECIGDGIATLTNLPEFVKKNCSGRYSLNTYSAEEIKSLIEESLQKENPRLREFSLENLDIDKQASKYMSL